MTLVLLSGSGGIHRTQLSFVPCGDQKTTSGRLAGSLGKPTTQRTGALCPEGTKDVGVYRAEQQTRPGVPVLSLCLEPCACGQRRAAQSLSHCTTPRVLCSSCTQGTSHTARITTGGWKNSRVRAYALACPAPAWWLMTCYKEIRCPLLACRCTDRQLLCLKIHE